MQNRRVALRKRSRYEHVLPCKSNIRINLRYKRNATRSAEHGVVMRKIRRRRKRKVSSVLHHNKCIHTYFSFIQAEAVGNKRSQRRVVVAGNAMMTLLLSPGRKRAQMTMSCPTKIIAARNVARAKGKAKPVADDIRGEALGHQEGDSSLQGYSRHQ